MRFHAHEMSRMGRPIVTGNSYLELGPGVGMFGEGGTVKGYRVSFWGNQNAAQWTAVMAAQVCE